VLCFEVHRNGRRLARAGLRRGVLSGIITWVSRKGKASPDRLPSSAVIPGLECSLGGLSTARLRHEEHVDWLTLRDLRFGDELSFRIVRAARPDRPRRREQSAVQRGRRHGVSVVKCSFCGRDRPGRRPNGVPGVTMGADAAICSNCAGAAQLMLESGSAGTLHLSVVSRRTCSFCAQHRSGVLVAATGATICHKCVMTVGELL
jgi:hypothetical protein